jgi:hypothetical protein
LQNQLSERLKYLICSSFLLNPGLQPDFYDSHSTPPMLSELDSFSEPLPSSNPPSPLRPLHRSLEFVKSFRFFRPHPRIVLSLSTLLILIGYHVSTSWALFSLPVIILTLFRPRALSAHRFRHIDIIPHLSPRTLQLEFQSAIVPEIAKLVNKCQALDLRISRAIGAVKEIECVALGLGLSVFTPTLPTTYKNDHTKKKVLDALLTRLSLSPHVFKFSDLIQCPQSPDWRLLRSLFPLPPQHKQPRKTISTPLESARS